MKVCLSHPRPPSRSPPFAFPSFLLPPFPLMAPPTSSVVAHPPWWISIPSDSSLDSFHPDGSLFSSLNSSSAIPPSGASDDNPPPSRPQLLLAEVNPTPFDVFPSALDEHQDMRPHLSHAHRDRLSMHDLSLSVSDADSVVHHSHHLLPDFHQERPSSAEISPSRVRLMCSFGGKIMARPVDGKLRYVGGETRIVAINRGVSFEEFMSKMSQFYGSPLQFKYQLPDEDLDSLVSVSSDDDLQNMMEEYDKAEVTSRIRLFFYSSPSELEVSGGLKTDVEEATHAFEQIFVDAVNGVAAEKLHSLVSENDTVGSKQVDSLESGDASGKIPPHESTDLLSYSKSASALSSYPSSPPRVPRQPPHYKAPLLDDANLQNLNEQSNKAVSPRGFDGDAEADISGGSFRVSYLDHQFHHEYLEHHICGAADSPDISHHDQSVSRTGIQGIDSSSSLALQSSQNMDYRTNLVPPMDHRHDAQHYSDVYVSQIEHQHFIQKQHHVPLQQHHFHPPPNVPHQQQHAWQVPIDGNSGHRPHEVFMQTQAFHQQHHYPSHHHSHHVPAVHERNMEYHALPTVYQKHPQFLHGLSPAPPYPMDLTRVAVHDHQGRCSCGLQHSQVHRGITVCIGEPSSSRWSGDQTFRKHGVFSSSRFPDGRSSFPDSLPWPHLVGTTEMEHREQAVHPRQHIHQRHPVDGSTECQSRYSPSCYDHQMHNDAYALAPDSQDACQGVAYFDNGRQIGNKSIGNLDYCDKNDQTSEWFLQQKTFEMEHGRLDVSWKTSLRNSIPVDENHRGESSDEKCIDGDSVLYRSQRVHGEPDSRMPMKAAINGMSHVKKSPIPSVKPLVSEELRSTQLVSNHGIESYPESVLLTSSEMHDVRNPAYFEPDLKGASSHCMQLNKPMEMVSDIQLSRDNRSVTSSALLEQGVHQSYESLTVSRKSVYGHGEFEVSSSGKRCDNKSNKQDVSTPSEIAGTGSAVTNHAVADAEFRESSVIQLQEFETVTRPHVHHDIFTTSFNSAVMGDASATPTNDKSDATNSNFSFFQSELSSQSIVETEESWKKTSPSDINETGSNFAVNKFPGDVNGLIVNKNSVNGPEVDMKFENLPSSVTKEHESKKSNKNVEGKSDVGTISHQVCSSILREDFLFLPKGSMSLGLMQVNDSQMGKLCEEDAEKPHLSQPEEEARARGLQIIKNADLEDLKELGSGTFGTVYHGKWRGSDVAIKRIKSSCFSGSPSEKERLISDFWKEAGTLAHLHHPNVVAFYGVVPDGPEERTLATVTEYMVNGSLKQVLQKKDRTIDRRKRLFIAMDAAFGMEYLHSKNIVHFDLKCENLLVNMKDAHRPICKVGDFGLSKVKHQTLVSGGVRGTLPWMAPELLSGNSNMVTEKVDVYSFGIVMWELLTGEEPYANMQFGAIIRGIVDNTLRPAVPSWCDPGWRQLMEKCWSSEPAERPSFTEVALELRSMAASMNIK